MSGTSIDIQGGRFLINGAPTYSEVEKGNRAARGLLMNARFIQGIFDDRADPRRFARFGAEEYDPDRNTDDLIRALPLWHSYGLRAFTVGLQGGGPCSTIDDWSSIDNSPFSPDGKRFDEAYGRRLDRLIRGADKAGVAVIVSFFYQAQSHRLEDGMAYLNAVKTACTVLKDIGCANIMIEIANEHNVGRFASHPLVYSSEGVVALMNLARERSGLPVGCSAGGGETDAEILRYSDIGLIHGNGCTRQQYYNMVKRAKACNPAIPVVCNEDSQCLGNLAVSFENQASWGYYNNMTKQEPPADWGITNGEDLFFARRMAEGIGIKTEPLPFEEQFQLLGAEQPNRLGSRAWIRLASLYPEQVDKVKFFMDGRLLDIAYDEPFSVNHICNWLQGPTILTGSDRVLSAQVYLKDGRIVEKTAQLNG